VPLSLFLPLPPLEICVFSSFPSDVCVWLVGGDFVFLLRGYVKTASTKRLKNKKKTNCTSQVKSTERYNKERKQTRQDTNNATDASRVVCDAADAAYFISATPPWRHTPCCCSYMYKLASCGHSLLRSSRPNVVPVCGYFCCFFGIRNLWIRQITSNSSNSCYRSCN
jgi:hypothetical protein